MDMCYVNKKNPHSMVEVFPNRMWIMLITMGAGDIVNVSEHPLGRQVIHIIHIRLGKTSTIECGFFLLT